MLKGISGGQLLQPQCSKEEWNQKWVHTDHEGSVLSFVIFSYISLCPSRKSVPAADSSHCGWSWVCFFFHPLLIFNNKFPCCGFCLLPLDYMPPRKESCPCLLWCNSLDRSFWAKQGLPSIIGLSDCHSAFKIFQLVVSAGKCPFPMTGECPMVILHRLNAIQPAILCVTRDKKPHKKQPMKHSQTVRTSETRKMKIILKKAKVLSFRSWNT